jgi:hypothetical protein
VISDVHHQFHPRANSPDPPRGLSVYRRLCAGEPDPVLDLVAAGLDRHIADALVRAVLPRSGAGDAGTRGHRGGASRRAHLDDNECAAAGRTRSRRPAAAAYLDLHERVQLPREPQSGGRADRPDRLSARHLHQRRTRQGERGQRAQLAGDLNAQRTHRRDPDRGPGGAPDRVVRSRGAVDRRGRAVRLDPLRIAPSTCRKAPKPWFPKARPRSPARPFWPISGLATAAGLTAPINHPGRRPAGRPRQWRSGPALAICR